MATVLKEKTTLGRQAAVAGTIVAGLFLICFGLLWHAFHLHGFGRRFYIEAGIGFVLVVLLEQLSNLAMVYIRGYSGERRVSNVLRKLSDEYRILNDVTIKVDEAEAQIDHVVVSPYGLWCLETKSHRGMTFGKERDQNWTQVKHSEKGRRYKNKLYSPIRQNATHCKRLGDFINQQLGLSVPIRSVVVFSHGKFEVESVTPVVAPGGVLQAMLTPDLKPIITEEDVARIVRVLLDSGAVPSAA